MFLHLSVSHSVHGRGVKGVCIGRGCAWQGDVHGRGLHAGEMATEAGGMHPTGMYSSCKLISCNKTAFQ